MPDFARSTSPAVQSQLDRLTSLSPGRDTLGLERISALLNRLGNPHLDLPPVFHVAGTNGKGSTCAYLRAAIEASGQSCHVYSSPHLVRFNERIRLNGQLISDAALASYLKDVLDVADGLDPSFFEATTAAAFLAFAQHRADAAIIEVGLGGRLDATNVIEHPAICGIASLGIDHEAFLLSPEPDIADLPQEPLHRIAWEKAGIAKPGVTLVTHRHSPEMMTVIATRVMTAGARLLARGDDWDAVHYDAMLHYRDSIGHLTLPEPGLPGLHQMDNAALAIAMLRHQSAITLPNSALSAAMGWASWPARLQRIEAGPLTGITGPGFEIWLDGGHNRDAGKALLSHVQKLGQRIHLVLGMLSNKDPGALIEPLAPWLASVSVVPVPEHAAHDRDAFSAFMPKDIPLSAFADVPAALHHISRAEPLPVLIGGSLYLAGEVLQLNDMQPE